MTEQRTQEPAGSTAAEAAPPAGHGEAATPTSSRVDGEEARATFPVQVDAALAYVADNKYDYGPRYSRLDLAWEVTGAQPMTQDITRVYLSYRPAASFRGASGAEYLDVGSDGAIQARRQLRVPKENLPWVLMGFSAFSVVLAAALVPLIIFYEGTGDPNYVSGRTLWMRASDPETQEFIRYSGPNINGDVLDWAIAPETAGQRLAAVQVTLINQTSGSVNIVIDEEAAELRTSDQRIHRPVDTVARAYNATPADTVEQQRLIIDGFLPLWGTIRLDQGTQVSGYMVFEVPPGSKYTEFRWSASDTAIVRYQ